MSCWISSDRATRHVTRCNNVSPAAEVTQIRQSPDKYRSGTLCGSAPSLGARDAGRMRFRPDATAQHNIHHVILFCSIKCEYLNMQSAPDDAHHHLTAECWHSGTVPAAKTHHHHNTVMTSKGRLPSGPVISAVCLSDLQSLLQKDAPHAGLNQSLCGWRRWHHARFSGGWAHEY